MLNDNWLLWSVPLVLVSLILLIFVIMRLVKKIGSAELVSASLSEEMPIDFPAIGDIQMHLVGPRFSRAFSGLKFNLINAANKQNIPLSRSMPLQSSGVSEIKMAHSRFSLETTGKHLLQVRGLQEQKSYAGCRILFTRPYTLYVVMCIIGILLSGGGFIGGIVMSLIYLGNA